MALRVGKVKVYNDEGHLIREGYARDGDFHAPKILGIFSPGELVKGGLITIGIIFGAGVLYSKMDTMDKNSDRMWQTITGNKGKLECVQNQLAKCCKDSIYCS